MKVVKAQPSATSTSASHGVTGATSVVESNGIPAQKRMKMAADVKPSEVGEMHIKQRKHSLPEIAKKNVHRKRAKETEKKTRIFRVKSHSSRVAQVAGLSTTRNKVDPTLPQTAVKMMQVFVEKASTRVAADVLPANCKLKERIPHTRRRPKNLLKEPKVRQPDMPVPPKIEFDFFKDKEEYGQIQIKLPLLVFWYH